MTSKNTVYTKINTADNMHVVTSLDEPTKPNEFVCVLNKDKPGGQMDLRLDCMVKMYLEPTEEQVGGE